MNEEVVRIHKAIEGAKEVADFVAHIGGYEYPGFYGMSDARECAMLLREATGRMFYARTCEGQEGERDIYYVD